MAHGTLKPKTWFEETERASEPDSEKAEVLELSDQEFKPIIKYAGSIYYII